MNLEKCKVCGCYIEGSEQGRPKEYCSNKCKWGFRRQNDRPLKNKICLNCNKSFLSHSKIKKFCSNECYKEHRNREKRTRGEIQKCKFCGIVFLIKERNAIYCSDLCCKRAWAGRNKIDKVCVICGGRFKTNRKSTKCCSRECTNQLIQNKIIKICEYCGEEFKVAQCFNKQMYCNRKCVQAANFAKWGEATEFKKYLRRTKEMIKLRDECLKRDNNMSVLSGKINNLHHHHIIPLHAIVAEHGITRNNWRDFLFVLCDIDNVITMTNKEHILFHKIYGIDADERDFMNFIKSGVWSFK